MYYNNFFNPDHSRERNRWPQESWQKRPPCLSLASTNSGATFEVDRKRARLNELEEAAAREGFWDSPEKAESFLKERKVLETFLAKWTEIAKTLEDLHAYHELADESEDDSLAAAIEEHARSLADRLADLEMDRMLGGGGGARDAIMTVP